MAVLSDIALSDDLQLARNIIYMDIGSCIGLEW